MTNTIINGDILKAKFGIVCHQVNCRGKMGAGIALKIRKKWPQAYKDYMEAYEERRLIPGEVILSTIVPDQLYVANICGQLDYGRNKQYTIYEAVKQGLQKVNIIANELGLLVYIPKNMGCALAGGDWNIVSSIIEEVIPNAIIVNFFINKD